MEGIRARIGTRFALSDAAAMMRALVIDDDHSVGMAIQLILARHGFETTLAPDGLSGLQFFESCKFDVVIVDIFIPGMSGIEAIAAFRRRSPIVPIIAMSGFRFRDSMGPRLDVLGTAVKFGATSCLPKPFAPDQLIAAIDSSFDASVSGGFEPEQGSTP
jgi:CheY-like chemotaxis protein